MRNEYQKREIAKQRYESLRKIKRELEEQKRWARFEKDREKWDEQLNEDLRYYEMMAKDQDGCGW